MRASSYQPGDFRDVAVEVHRAGAIGEHHVPTVAIMLSKEWPETHVDVSLEELAARFDREAEQIAEALIGSLPGGTLDRLVGKLLAYKASHFVVNHETPRYVDSAPDLLAVAKALDAFQRTYEANTSDTMPGNAHYAEMAMVIVRAARAAIAKAEGAA